MKRRRIVGAIAALAVVVANAAVLLFRRPARTLPADGNAHVSAVWARETVPGTSSLHAVWIDERNEGVSPVAVGDDGVILMRGENATWNAARSPTKATLRAVAGGYDAFAVGDDGTILYYDRSRHDWTLEPSGTHENLYGVAVPRDTAPSAIVVGAHGVVLRREVNQRGEGSWVRVPVTTSADLFAVQVFSERVIVTGATGTVLGSDRLTGRTAPLVLTAQTTPSGAALRAISRTDTQAVAIGGAHGTLLTSLGDRPWVVESLPTTDDLKAIVYFSLPQAVMLPSGARVRAVAASFVVATDDRVYARVAEIGRPPPRPRERRHASAVARIVG
jgi:hypothetical protein